MCFVRLYFSYYLDHKKRGLIQVRDFNYAQEIWAVVKADGTFAGVPCLSWEEARELKAQHEYSWIYAMCPDPNGNVILEDEDDQTLEDDALNFDDFYNDDEMGFNPYLGCYDYDC